ncbi:MAG: hypothetical protein QNJ65_00135 [Xenococcaceae cyanobacterium MO_234.B1]|nr:hypothetical protein [Xenococcaceae cyanobacterium MO_234.B1]
MLICISPAAQELIFHLCLSHLAIANFSDRQMGKKSQKLANPTH